MNQTSDLITVIVPVFKVEPYLDACIQSIADQTYQNLEIILIDDGSPDRCPQICDKWAEEDPRIIVIHSENGGVSRARNKGMEKANGRYLVFVDSDDFLEPHYIEYLYRALCETGADISECRYTRNLDLPEKSSARMTMSQPVILTAEEALRIWNHPDKQALNLVVWNKMYRSELVRKVRFAEGYGGGEDVLFTCLVFGKCGKIACIDNALYHWRDTPGSASKKFPDNSLQSIELLFAAIEYLEQEYPSFTADCKIRICHIINAVIYTIQYETALENEKEVKEKMLSFRRRIHFTAKEWRQRSLKEKIMILCSRTSTVGIYIRLRHFLYKIGWH